MNLLYLTFGDNIGNHTQAHFSIYSFLAGNVQAASINIITDKPWYYKSIENKVNIIEADAQLLSEWMGPHRFFWRVKIKAIEKICGLYPGAPVLYLDSDTFFYGDPISFDNLAGGQQAAMFENEGPLRTLGSKTMKTMARQVKNLSIAGINQLAEKDMWNAGVVFTPNQLEGKEMELALTLCDEMCRLKVKDQFVEQFALSVALAQCYGLNATGKLLAHYWSNKKEWNELIRTFFIENQMFGLNFEEELERFRAIDLCQYPVVRISGSTNRRLKQKIDRFWGDKKVEYLSRDVK